MLKNFIINVDSGKNLFCLENIECEIVDTIQINNYEFNILPEWVNLKKNCKITIPEISIALTHYAIWNKIVDNKIKTALILENDGIPTENFNKICSDINNIVFDYDLLYLGRTPVNSSNEISINNLFAKPLYSHGSYAYILTYAGAVKLLNCNFLNNLLPIDEFLSIMHDNNYPYKFYSIFFNNFDKLHAFALKTNIVNKTKTKKNNKGLSYLDLISKNENLYNEKEHKKIQSALVNNWILHNISENSLIDCLNNMEKNNKFLLRKTDIENYDVLENYVYKIMKFHIQILNISENTIEVEFLYKTGDSHLHIENNNPILSTITYLNDNRNSPTIITNINQENHKFKDFNGEKLICFSFPCKSKHISFEGGKYYHGYYNFADENCKSNAVLLINLHNKKITNIPYYISSTTIYDNCEIAFDNFEHKTVIANESLINQEFLESICYEYDKYDKTIFNEFISKIDDKTNCFIFKTECKSSFNIENFNFANNIFVPSFHFKKHFNKETCMWLISETENFAKVQNWKNIYKTFIPTACLSFLTIPHLQSFLKFSFNESIAPLIKKSFELNSNVNINIINLFVVKYEDDEPDSKELYKDKCNITVSILLSKVLNKTSDDSIMLLEQGDLLINETSIRNQNCESDDESVTNNLKPIAFHKRYILYFFINFTKSS